MGQHCNQMYQIGTHLASVHKNPEADALIKCLIDKLSQLIPNLEIF